MPFRLIRLLRLAITTLKFKIVAIAVVTGVASAAVTTYFVLSQTRFDTQRMLLQQVADERERSAALLGSKVDLLRASLVSTAAQIKPALLQQPAELAVFLQGQAPLHALFDNVFVTRADGTMQARVRQGDISSDLPQIADREYFRRVMETGLPLVSRPLIGRASKTPMVIVAVPVKSAGGTVIGCLGGALLLHSSGLLANQSQEDSLDLSREMVIDASGFVIAHANPMRLMGRAEDEPGFGPAYRGWAAAGRTVHIEGAASLSDGYLVSMAGVPFAEWMVVRLMPESVALQPLQAAQQTAWRAAAGVGLSAALLAGALAWLITHRISTLRRHAERLLRDTDAPADEWPHGDDEVGELARAFLHVVEQRHARQVEMQAVLHQLEAVLDNADVGIAFTRDGRFELVSQQFCRIFGCDKSQARGQPTRMIYASDEAYQNLAERARPALTEHGAFDGELELVRRSGQRFWAHMRGRAVVPGDASQGTIWILEDVTQVREQRERLAWSASHDSLTGLANRAEFEALLMQATQRAVQAPFCALFIDLDRFKQVNDSAGHAAGDAMLRDLAHALSAQVRQTDVVARLGGDEFAVLLPQCPTAQAMAIAEKLRAAVEGYALLWEGERFSVGASIGLVPVDGRFASHGDVMRAADSACYAAKRTGRNRVVVYDGSEAAAAGSSISVCGMPSSM